MQGGGYSQWVSEGLLSVFNPHCCFCCSACPSSFSLCSSEQPAAAREAAPFGLMSSQNYSLMSMGEHMYMSLCVCVSISLCPCLFCLATLSLQLGHAIKRDDYSRKWDAIAGKVDERHLQTNRPECIFCMSRQNVCQRGDHRSHQSLCG